MPVLDKAHKTNHIQAHASIITCLFYLFALMNMQFVDVN